MKKIVRAANVSLGKKATEGKTTVSGTFLLPTTAELPSVGELPELPDFSDFSKTMQPSGETATNKSIPSSSDNPQLQLTDSAEISSSRKDDSTAREKPKLWWLSWLLPGKKQPIIDAQSTDVTAQTAATLDTNAELSNNDNTVSSQNSSQKSLSSPLAVEERVNESSSTAKILSKRSKGKRAKESNNQETHIARAYTEIDGIKAKIDAEMRERQSIVDAHHEQVKVKESELEKWHADLLVREKEIVKNEKEYERIKKLEQQLEDKEITLKYKEDEIEDLKNQLAHKELELTQQEASLKALSIKLDTLQAQKQRIVSDAEHTVSDDYHKLAKRNSISDKQKRVEPRTVLSKALSTIDTASKRDVRNLLLRAYDQLAAGDMAALQMTYNKIRESYAAMIVKTGQDEQLYQDIIDLYSDIKLAVVQRS